MPRRGSAYGPQYIRERRLLLGRPCWLRLVCEGSPADSADHDPPLVLHRHVPGSGCCVLRPACRRCQRRQGSRLAWARRRGLHLLVRDRGRETGTPAPSRSW